MAVLHVDEVSPAMTHVLQRGATVLELSVLLHVNSRKDINRV